MLKENWKPYLYSVHFIKFREIFLKIGACLFEGDLILLNIFFWCSTCKHLLKNIKVTVKSCLVDKEVSACICVIDDVTFEFLLKKNASELVQHCEERGHNICVTPRLL